MFFFLEYFINSQAQQLFGSDFLKMFIIHLQYTIVRTEGLLRTQNTKIWSPTYSETNDIPVFQKRESRKKDGFSQSADAIVIIENSMEGKMSKRKTYGVTSITTTSRGL